MEFEKYSYGGWIQTFQTLMFTKISICFFLLRIPVEKRSIRPIQVIYRCTYISNIILTLLWILQCVSVARAWNTQTPGTCFTDTQLQRIIISKAIISIIFRLCACSVPHHTFMENSDSTAHQGWIMYTINGSGPVVCYKYLTFLIIVH